MYVLAASTLEAPDGMMFTLRTRVARPRLENELTKARALPLWVAPASRCQLLGCTGCAASTRCPDRALLCVQGAPTCWEWPQVLGRTQPNGDSLLSVSAVVDGIVTFEDLGDAERFAALLEADGIDEVPDGIAAQPV